MEELLNLLRDGHSRSIEMLAAELKTSTEDIIRRIEFLERAGIIRRVLNIKNDCSGGCPGGHSCGTCPGCRSHTENSANSPCKGCLPEGGFKNMGEMWEVVK
ncbi:MAG: Lrp/AsnC family transcriptional regulator [Treponema sp.]|nr:Lrp/AsnC family transcriptional regulator [Treponema sp.]